MVCKERTDAKMLVIGGGEKYYINKFSEEVKKAGLERNIIYAGPARDRRKYTLLKSAKLFSFPSYEEGWGIVVGEAMACGLPVVAYDLPAYKGTFRKGIITIPLRNKEQFASAIVRLLMRDDLRQELGEEAKIQAKEYDWDSIALKDLKSITRLNEQNPKGL